MLVFFFFFQAEDGIRDLVRSRGLGDVYKRQCLCYTWRRTVYLNTRRNVGMDPTALRIGPITIYWLSLIHI